jgi:hypothetical protein
LVLLPVVAVTVVTAVVVGVVREDLKETNSSTGGATTLKAHIQVAEQVQPAMVAEEVQSVMVVEQEQVQPVMVAE